MPERTNKNTVRGRPVYRDTETGDLFSEKTVTVPYGDGYVVIPSVIDNGMSLSEDDLFEYVAEKGPYDPLTGEELPVHAGLDEADRYAQWRSDNQFNESILDENYWHRDASMPYYADPSQGYNPDSPTLSSYRPTLRDNARNNIRDTLEGFGLSEGVSRDVATGLAGEENPTDGGLGMGLMDFTPLGIAMGGQEARRDFNRASNSEDYVEMGMAGVQGALTLAEAIPLTGVALKGAGRGIQALSEQLLRGYEPNTVGSNLGNLLDTPATSETVDTVLEEALVKPVSASAPQKTVKAYKLFRTNPSKPGELFPLFVNADKSVDTGKWVDAEVGPLNEGGKVKSKIGALAFRPGWHAGDYIAATHIGGKSTPDLKKPDYRPADQVWAEVEMPDDVNWQDIAEQRARIKKDGNMDVKTAHITDQVPQGGFYRYKTNPNMQGNWMIGGSMKVNKKLEAEEAKQVQAETGIYDLPTLPELIDQKSLSLEDLTQSAQKELQTHYPEKYETLSALNFALGGLAVARKGIMTPEGEDMADKKFQLDENEADLNDDGSLSTYEKTRADAVQKATAGDDELGMYHGGMMGPVDPVSGNPIPVGSSAEEVRDDIDINISQGEYVLPADVVKWHGLKHIMDMQEEAKMGLMAMDAMGFIQAADGEAVEDGVCPICMDEECEGCEETVSDDVETPEGEVVEEAVVEVSEEEKSTKQMIIKTVIILKRLPCTAW
jgi:hypothetical protein